MAIALRLVQLMLVALAGLLVARGALYGFVDHGPYEDSWGGPSRTGAWLVHFAVSLPAGAVVVALYVGVDRLRRRVVRHAQGEPRHGG